MTGRIDPLHERLSAWIDGVLVADDPPAGVAAEILEAVRAEGEGQAGDAPPPPGVTGEDLYSLWGAVTALTQEVRLQGRSFGELTRALAVAEERAETASAAAQARAAVDTATLRQAEERGRRQMLAAMLDIRDRLKRSLSFAKDHASASRADLERSWLRRRFGGGGPAAAQAFSALEEGYVLSLARLDDTLAGLGVTEVPCRGRRFDPSRMQAVEVDAASEAPDGSVIEVVMAGYEQDGQIIRPAKVRVARRS